MRCVIAAIVFSLAFGMASAQTSPPTEPPAGILYALEITTGPSWDKARSPGEQAYFREHSANLKRLRDQGVLLLGARYSDKGFIVLRAPSEQDARAMIQQDPAIQHGTFKYELHEFNVFYSGTVPARPRSP